MSVYKIYKIEYVNKQVSNVFMKLSPFLGQIEIV